MAMNAAGTAISERGLLCRFLCHPMASFRSFQAVGAFEELTQKPLIHKHLSQWGHVAEWLRNGLQNRVHQFNSGRGLHLFRHLAGLCEATKFSSVFRQQEREPQHGQRRASGGRWSAVETWPLVGCLRTR
jgi:hypothetical protein